MVGTYNYNDISVFLTVSNFRTDMSIMIKSGIDKTILHKKSGGKKCIIIKTGRSSCITVACLDHQVFYYLYVLPGDIFINQYNLF